MTEWAQELKEHGEFATDEVLGHLISLRQLDDEVQDTLYNGAGAEARTDGAAMGPARPARDLRADRRHHRLVRAAPVPHPRQPPWARARTRRR